MAIEWRTARGAGDAVLDLDGETLSMARDPALAERPIHMSMGLWPRGHARILRLMDRYDLRVGF